jgi:hypothetical protein
MFLCNFSIKEYKEYKPKSKNRTIQTPNSQSKPKKCTPFKPCLQKNTGIFSMRGRIKIPYKDLSSFKLVAIFYAR